VDRKDKRLPPQAGSGRFFGRNMAVLASNGQEKQEFEDKEIAADKLSWLSIPSADK